MNELTERKTLCDIAHFTFEVVNDWLNDDQILASELRSSETGSRQFVGEETITVDLARKLRTQFHKHTELKLFTHPEEKRTGSDWYWRIERGNHAIHALVQAKRVQRTAFGQQDGHGYIDLDYSQLERLLEATRTASYQISGLEAWVATYARFNATPPCGYSNLQRCRNHTHASDCVNNQSSFWIANAHEILDAKNWRLSVREIVQHSVRLDCVLPCIDRLGVSGPAEKGFVLQSDLPSFQECVATIENDGQLYSGLKGALRIFQ